MPEPKTNPTAPAAAPAPAAPAPAAPAVTRPAAEPRAARPAQPAAPSIKPPVSSTRPRPSISAKKALGLEETPRKSMESVLKSGRDRITATSPSTELKTEVPVVAAPEPAAPAVEAPAPAAPAAAPAPAKIKVGEKEYTPEELEAALKAAQTPAAPAAAAPAREEAPPAPPAPPTKEQIEAAEKKFVEETVKVMDAPLTEAEMDTILAGGKDAVETLQAIRKRDMANTVLQTRKSVADSLNPLFDEVFNALRPLVANHQQVQRYNVEQQFVSKHADFAPHVETARAVAEELVKLYPQQVAKMSQEQFIDEVARQSDIILTTQHKRWFPQGNGNWRTSAAPPAAAPVAAAPVTQPVAAAPVAPQPTRVVRAPAATVPIGSGGITPPGWGKSVASSMRG